MTILKFKTLDKQTDSWTDSGADYGTDYETDSGTDSCPIHVVTFSLISNLATDYIQKRTG